jgi:putative peptidoglycan lipid II flippase
MQMPETIIGTAIGTAIFPTLSEYVSRDDRVGLRSTLRRALIVLVALIVPITIVSLFLVRPAVQIVFEGRSFTAAGTNLVVSAAQMFLLGMLGHSLLEVVVRMFYALHDAITPLIAAALTALSFVLLCVVFVPIMGHTGIALANTLAFTAEAAGLLWLLSRRHVF